MSKKLKVLHLLHSDRFSGAENVVCQIIDIFREDESIEMAYCSQDGPIREVLLERDISFHPMMKFTFKEVKRVINEYKPDVIHAHDAHTSVCAAFVAKKIPIISHIHGNHDNMKIISFKSISYMITSIRYKRIFWVSNSALKEYFFHTFVKRKSFILRNVINRDKVRERAKLDTRDHSYDCVFVGRLCDIKNPLRAISILSKVIEQKQGFTAAFIGTGELTAQCSHMIQNLGLDKNIFLLGFQKNPLKIISNAKVLLMTSRYEGTPMCALEAMALDVPIVSTPTDGLIELIENGRTGYLSNEDDILSSSIYELTNNRKKKNEFSQATNSSFIKLNNLEDYYASLHEAYLNKC